MKTRVVVQSVLSLSYFVFGKYGQTSTRIFNPVDTTAGGTIRPNVPYIPHIEHAKSVCPIVNAVCPLFIAAEEMCRRKLKTRRVKWRLACYIEKTCKTIDNMVWWRTLTSETDDARTGTFACCHNVNQAKQAPRHSHRRHIKHTTTNTHTMPYH